MTSNYLINEIKLRVQSSFYRPIKTSNLECDKYKISQKIEQERNELIQKLEELKRSKEKTEKLAKKVEEEERRYNELLSSMKTRNRTTLNDSGSSGFGKFIMVAAATIVGAFSACNIF